MAVRLESWRWLRLHPHLSRYFLGLPWPLVMGLALFVAGCTSDDSRPELPSTVGSSQAASVEELEGVLAGSVEKLYEAAGIEFVEHHYLDGELSRTVWAKSWPNGDFVSVENTDLSVAEGGSSGVVATRARVQVGDMLYTAGTGSDGVGSPWRGVELTEELAQDRFLPISVPLEALGNGFFLFDLDEVAADSTTVQRSGTTTNGVLWSLELSVSDQVETIQHWEVDEAGHLALLSMRIDGLAPQGEVAPSTRFPNTPTATSDPSRLREIVVEFTPIDGHEQLSVPPTGEFLDLDELGVPDVLPLIPGS